MADDKRFVVVYKQGGFANPQFPDWFENYARVCFEAFGDRVPMWSTFNESVVAVTYGYIRGTFPPFEKNLQKGLRACHFCLLAHFRAVKLYKSMGLPGKIGAVNPLAPVAPIHLTEEDIGASRRQMEYTFDCNLNIDEMLTLYFYVGYADGDYKQFIIDDMSMEKIG